MCLLILGFDQTWRGLFVVLHGYPRSIFFYCALTALAAIGTGIVAKTLTGTLLLTGLIGLIVVICQLRPEFVSDTVMQVLANVAAVVSGVYLIRLATRNSDGLFFFIGVGLILLVGLLRYIDLVGGYIGGSILFAVMAAIMLMLARYWQRTSDKKTRELED